MAARNKPAGIRSLVYGIGKGKGGIEGLSVSACLSEGWLDQADQEHLFSHFLGVAEHQHLVVPLSLVANP